MWMQSARLAPSISNSTPLRRNSDIIIRGNGLQLVFSTWVSDMGLARKGAQTLGDKPAWRWELLCYGCKSRWVE